MPATSSRRAAAYMSLYTTQYGPKGRFPQLPLELLHVVAAHADPHTLTKLCLTNSVVGDVAASYLYADVRLTKLVSVVKCLKTMNNHPELAKHTRVLSIHVDADLPRLTNAFGALLRGALHHMPHLVTLELDLGEDALGRYLRGSPFRITNLSLACDWDADLAAWLEEQPAILRFMLYGDPRSPISLDPSALPDLKSLFGTPAVISSIVPGRPVKQVVATVYSRTIFTEPVIERMALSCKSSTGPISAVSIIHQTRRAPLPEETFRILSSIPLHLPGLRKFAMQAYSYSFEESICELLRQFITGFRALQCVDLFTKERYGEVLENNKAKLNDLARSFGKSCPSLRSVRFSPDSFYAYHPSGEWVSVRDLNLLHEDVISSFLLTVESMHPMVPGGVSTTDQPTGSTSPKPAVPPQPRVPLLPDILDMNNTLTRLNIALGWRGSTAVRCLDLSSPEMDADLAASVTVAYETCCRLLRKIQGRGDSR